MADESTSAAQRDAQLAMHRTILQALGTVPITAATSTVGQAYEGNPFYWRVGAHPSGGPAAVCAWHARNVRVLLEQYRRESARFDEPNLVRSLEQLLPTAVADEAPLLHSLLSALCAWQHSSAALDSALEAIGVERGEDLPDLSGYPQASESERQRRQLLADEHRRKGGEVQLGSDGALYCLHMDTYETDSAHADDPLSLRSRAREAAAGSTCAAPPLPPYAHHPARLPVNTARPLPTRRGEEGSEERLRWTTIEHSCVLSRILSPLRARALDLVHTMRQQQEALTENKQAQMHSAATLTGAESEPTAAPAAASASDAAAVLPGFAAATPPLRNAAATGAATADFVTSSATSAPSLPSSSSRPSLIFATPWSSSLKPALVQLISNCRSVLEAMAALNWLDAQIVRIDETG